MECPLSTKLSELDYLYICRRGSFGTLLYLKCNLIAFIERLEAICIYTRMMNKYIRTILLLNEAIALVVIEPLHDSICHNNILLSNNSHASRLQDATFDKWNVPSE